MKVKRNQVVEIDGEQYRVITVNPAQNLITMQFMHTPAPPAPPEPVEEPVDEPVIQEEEQEKDEGW